MRFPGGGGHPENGGHHPHHDEGLSGHLFRLLQSHQVQHGRSNVAETAVAQLHGITLITADHGNADRMLEEDGETPYTAHTTSPVPFYIVGATRS